MKAIARNILLHHLRTEYVSRAGRPRTLAPDYVLERIAHVLRTGCQWTNLPIGNGSWKTIYHYFSQWSNQHVFERVFLGHSTLLYSSTRRSFQKHRRPHVIREERLGTRLSGEITRGHRLKSNEDICNHRQYRNANVLAVSSRQQERWKGLWPICFRRWTDYLRSKAVACLETKAI